MIPQQNIIPSYPLQGICHSETPLEVIKIAIFKDKVIQVTGNCPQVGRRQCHASFLS